LRSFDISNWYWKVAGETHRVFSSARASYVPSDDTLYLAWVAADDPDASSIASEAELFDLLATQYPAGLPAGAGGTGAFQLDPKTQEYLNRLKTNTPAEIDAWLNNNTGNSAAIREVVKMLVRIDVLQVRKAQL
jgi:hypothetical protein